ncbi:DNA glycosylase [Parathielavia appendiculata]|uniref:DNA-(apurinic or apyrimidinic site) lyase n=1 Tax=Parathielavia appendiculata TaxID=2587402 RepID=A0AAN6U5Y0_9PEZI|nr:DNA glycosylase [Parathielavia appendiculata]
MGAHKLSDWRKLPLSLTELCIDTTLRCGQSFRWRKISDEWHCVLRGRLISLKQDASHLHYRVTWPKPTGSPVTSSDSIPAAGDGDVDTEQDDTESLLRNYFALSHSLSTLYQQWAASDANFARRAPAFTGIRILNQDAWEALVAFICSSNNNIGRISQMVQKLCIHYGPYIGTIEGEAFHDFPEPQALSGTHVEAHLRELGFGYRAAYIAQTAEIISYLKGADWLLRLRNPESPAFAAPITRPGQNETQSSSSSDETPITYRTAHEALLTLPGVGPKVADCVCLMGLGWGEAVPVDTHVWQIAQRDYHFSTKTKTKTFTKVMYNSVGDHFRSIWGPQAGWAQSVLFTSNLKAFAGQASGAGTKSGIVEEAIVKAEKMVRRSKQAHSLAEDYGMGVVKTDEEEVTTTFVRSRKRRITAVTKVSGSDKKHVGAVEVEVHTRRTSKRLKAAAS